MIVQAWFFAYMVCLGAALGALALLMTHSLTGGAWGRAVRPVLQACADTIPALGLLFLPVLLGARSLYPWLQAAPRHAFWFDPRFFVGRALIYFACWYGLALRQRRENPGGGLGLVVWAVTVSFAAFDWVMSLEPAWTSSIYGAIWLVGDALTALSFSVLALSVLQRGVPADRAVSDEAAIDLGNLLLAFTMLWAYIALSQYLIIWSGDLPREIGWYLVRRRGLWRGIAVVLALVQFALPFLLLLARERKRRLESLGRVAALILAMRALDVLWLVVPDLRAQGTGALFLNAPALLVVGGLWLWAFRRGLRAEGALL